MVRIDVQSNYLDFSGLCGSLMILVSMVMSLYVLKTISYCATITLSNFSIFNDFFFRNMCKRGGSIQKDIQFKETQLSTVMT